MTTDQILVFCVLGGVFGFLLWGRWRYDLVAFSALCVALVLGVVPPEQAFSGFGHEATVIVALVLVISRGLLASGAIEIVTRHVVDAKRSLSMHIGIVAGLSAALSAVMNNVAALALLMPVDIHAARKAGRSPALTLMPLSFATILGGLVTLIGTPPNVVIAGFRRERLGESFSMFDFAPVGGACALAGVLFVALVGWRLIPKERTQRDTPKELEDLEGFIAEARVGENSRAIGQQVRDLDEVAIQHDVGIIGLVRKGSRVPGYARGEVIREGDLLVLEAGPEAIETFIGALGLEYRGAEKFEGALAESITLLAVVVPEGARIEGRSALSMRLLHRHDVTLLGVSRRGKRFRSRVGRLWIRAGDILLLVGPEARLTEVANWLGTLPLAGRDLPVIQRDRAWLAIGVFATAITLASAEILPLHVALACCAATFVGLRVLPLGRLYDSVQWPVIVLLGSLLPIGAALETSGGTALIAGSIVDLSEGRSAAFVLVLVMIVTMTLSDVLNNTATAVVAAPVAIDIAARLKVSPDPFLMAVAVAASCAFLTPIGHKNNTLIMGPGGYRFGDYWRMGLPLEILIILVAVPMILWWWPF